ncbi:MAG: large subunit ribosomal protein L24 [Parcubacteria group bacterium Licking1014_17]|nr:MAG: large subunit ribosomal protein L24 [Parcubacteria group bacterium Licking1014_17]
MNAGKDKGKKGKVLFAFPESGKIMVEGLNIVKKHQRAKKQGQKGQIIGKERLVDASDAQIICPHCGKQTRVGYVITGAVKVRVCKKCKGELK